MHRTVAGCACGAVLVLAAIVPVQAQQPSGLRNILSATRAEERK